MRLDQWTISVAFFDFFPKFRQQSEIPKHFEVVSEKIRKSESLAIIAWEALWRILFRTYFEIISEVIFRNYFENIFRNRFGIFFLISKFRKNSCFGKCSFAENARFSRVVVVTIGERGAGRWEDLLSRPTFFVFPQIWGGSEPFFVLAMKAFICYGSAGKPDDVLIYYYYVYYLVYTAHRIMTYNIMCQVQQFVEKCYVRYCCLISHTAALVLRSILFTDCRFYDFIFKAKSKQQCTSVYNARSVHTFGDMSSPE